MDIEGIDTELVLACGCGYMRVIDYDPDIDLEYERMTEGDI